MINLHKIIATAVAVCITPILAMSQVLGIEGEKHTSVGLYIKDLKADTVVFAADADHNMVPASIMKSLTSATALSLLGPDYQFKTSAYLVGNIDGSTLNGVIRIIPGGDPTLESTHFKNNGGFADSIVANVRRHGITNITGGVVVDDDMTDGGPVPQWEIDDVAWAYGAGIHRFNYRDNTFTYNPATAKTNPVVPGLSVQSLPNTSGTNLVRGIWSNTLYAFMADKSAKSTFKSTVPYPAKVFEAELTDKLQAAGITVNSDNKAYNKTAKHINIYTHLSRPLSEILKSLMLRSDNMFAEACLWALADGKSRDVAIAREKKFWQGKVADAKYITVVDGSGLARVDRVSPQFMGDMLEYMAKGNMASQYTALFPRVGKEGTVKRFMAGTPLEGRMALKTGSMNGVQCYAGYVFDGDNKPSHVVVVMINSFFCSRDTLRTAIANWVLKYLD